MDETARQAAWSDLYALPGHLLWRAAARVSTEVARILPAGTDIHAFAVLRALADEEPQSQSSLARLTGVSGTTLTSVAHTLQRDDYVERVRNPDDRRSYSLTRTTAGRAAVLRWDPHVERLETHLTSSFAGGDAARLREVLEHAVDDELDERTPRVLRDSTGFLITKAHQRAHREFSEALRPFGIEPRHYGTLRLLRLAGPVSQGDVSALLDVSPATVVAIVDTLEQHGLVVRERDTSDRRAYRLHLAPAAMQVVDRGSALSTAVLEDRIGGPDSPDRHDLVRLLRLLLSPDPR